MVVVMMSMAVVKVLTLQLIIVIVKMEWKGLQHQQTHRPRYPTVEMEIRLQGRLSSAYAYRTIPPRRGQMPSAKDWARIVFHSITRIGWLLFGFYRSKEFRR
jgi:hypothetical protein